MTSRRFIGSPPLSKFESQPITAEPKSITKLKAEISALRTYCEEEKRRYLAKRLALDGFTQRTLEEQPLEEQLQVATIMMENASAETPNDIAITRLANNVLCDISNARVHHDWLYSLTNQLLTFHSNASGTELASQNGVTPLTEAVRHLKTKLTAQEEQVKVLNDTLRKEVTEHCKLLLSLIETCVTICRSYKLNTALKNAQLQLKALQSQVQTMVLKLNKIQNEFLIDSYPAHKVAALGQIRSTLTSRLEDMNIQKIKLQNVLKNINLVRNLTLWLRNMVNCMLKWRRESGILSYSSQSKR